MRSASALLLIPAAALLACGGGGHSSGGGSTSPPPPAGANVVPLTVNGSLCNPGTSASYPNKPCVEVTICTPGTSTCQTIGDILVDTGSWGLRLFKQVITVPLTNSPSGAGTLAECVQFADGSAEWGPVAMADVVLGGEAAVTVPIHVVDATFASVPSGCGTPETGPTLFNGILGVGLFAEDCGSGCTVAGNRRYYSCSGSSCPGTGVAVALENQVQNPVAHLAADNNGVIIQLPSVAPGGVVSVDGALILGIGTQANNTPSGVAYVADTSGNMRTVFDSSTKTSIVDSGSNGLYFAKPASLPACSSPNQDWYCPGSVTTLQATNEGAGGTPVVATSFQVSNFITLASSPNNAFSDLAGNVPAALAGYFDWGLPFFFGKRVHIGIEGTSSALGTGPYYAF